MRKGFGELIAQRRIAAGLSPEQLAERLGYKSKTVIYRLESETQEPDAAIINGLVAALPISADELLRAMGVNLNMPAASRIPRQLLDRIAELPPEGHQVLLAYSNWPKSACAGPFESSPSSN